MNIYHSCPLPYNNAGPYVCVCVQNFWEWYTCHHNFPTTPLPKLQIFQ